MVGIITKDFRFFFLFDVYFLKISFVVIVLCVVENCLLYKKK